MELHNCKEITAKIVTFMNFMFTLRQKFVHLYKSKDLFDKQCNNQQDFSCNRKFHLITLDSVQVGLTIMAKGNL